MLPFDASVLVPSCSRVCCSQREPVLNSQMRRIDLICKLAGPLFIALISGLSMDGAILFNFSMNILSVGYEYYAIAKVRTVLTKGSLCALCLIVRRFTCLYLSYSCRRRRQIQSPKGLTIGVELYFSAFTVPSPQQLPTCACTFIILLSYRRSHARCFTSRA